MDEIRVVRTQRGIEVIDLDGRTTGPLCMGECIEQVIGLMFAGINKTYPMHTPEEWAERSKSMSDLDLNEVFKEIS